MNLDRKNLPALASLLALSSASAAFAQTAPPAPEKKSDEVITLSEFSVKAEDDRGYVASETMTGSRINTKIIDLPYSTVNLTSEFFEDFGVLELDDSLTFIGGFTGLSIGGGFNLRGFSATSQLRDGFYRLGRYGQSNVDRIEIIRGPNAAIYGRSSPGGMINMISKQPKNQASQSLSFSNGSYDTRREKLEMTGPLANTSLGKTSYILTLSQYERRFDGEYAHTRNNEFYGAIKHDFTNGAHLMLTAEYFLNIRHAPNSAPPLVTDAKGTAATTDDVVVGYATNLAKYNAFGPNSELNRGSATYTAAYDKRISDVWSFRVASQYFRARRWDFNQNTGWGAITINPANGAAPTSARGATPTKGLIQEDGGGFQGDLVAHYYLANHTIENKTLLTLDFNDYYRWDPTFNYAGATNPEIVAWNSVRTVTLDRNTLTPVAPLSYFPSFFKWGQESLANRTRRRASSFGGNLKQQAFLFQNRLIAYAGFRYDAVRFSERDYTVVFPNLGVGPGNGVLRRWEHQLKPNVGFNAKISSNLRAYGSYSESYFVDQTVRPAVIADPNFKAETAKGVDYGIKGAFFEDRLNFTLGGYYISRYNVSVSDFVESPLGSGNFITQTLYDGDQLVRGWEADLSWRMTESLTLGGSFANVNSKYTDFGSASPLTVGRSVANVTPENGSLYAKYNFNQGALKGLSLNALTSYVSSTPSEQPNAGDTYANVSGKRVLTSSTYQWKLRTPSYIVWNFGAHYRLPRLKNFEQTLGLNVNNAFDKFYLRTGKTLGDSRSILFTYELRHIGSVR
jgi:iron complex outermembrane receptor protein